MKKVLLNLAVLLVVNLLGVNVIAKEAEISFTLDEIVVTASKYEEKLSEAPVSVEVIDEEEIKQKNAHNVADLLRNLAGVSFTDYGGIAGLKTIVIRGSSAKQVLILVDGQVMNDCQGGDFDLGQLNIEQIKRIEVLRGPASALYGANALGGVVNIITKDVSQTPETILNLGYGSFNTQRYNLSHSGSIKKLDYNVFVTKKKSDGYRNHSGLGQETVFTKLAYRLDNYSDLILSLQHNNSDKESPGKDKAGWKTPNAEQNDKNTNLNLQWKKQTEHNDMKLAIYHTDSERCYDNDTTLPGYSEHIKKKTVLDFNRTDYYQNHILTYGGELKKNKIDSTQDGKHDNMNKAVFIQDKWQVNRLWKVSLGGRYDDHEVFGSEFSPEVGTVYVINKKLNLHASVGKAYRAPSFDDLYWEQPMLGMIGNSNLKPETAISYETGLRYLDGSLKGEVNVFKKDVDDMISWKYNKEGDFMYKPYNINSAKISGIELILAKYLTEKISTNLNYTYLDARDKQTGERLTFRDYHNLNLGLNYNTEEISVSLNGRLVAGRSDDLPSYFVVDAKLNKKIKENIEVSLGINNLFDKKYEIIEDYPMPERNYMLKVSTKF